MPQIQQQRRCRVLIIEDDPDVRRLVSELVAEDGYEVRAAADGIEALATAGEFDPDVLVVDLLMPRMDGATFLREFRASPANRAAVLVLSAVRSEIPAEANAYIAKPFIVDDLTHEMSRLCEAVLAGGPLPAPIRTGLGLAASLSAEGEVTTASRIRLLIVEDQRVLADVLALAIADEHDIEVAGVAASAATAVRMAAASRPDVVVMDYHLPDRDGVSASREIHAARPDLPIIILTGDTSDEVLLAALNAGVSGFLVKSDSFTDLVSSIRRAAAGEILWPADRLARLLARTAQSSPAPARPSELTRRERDVLRLMSEGLDNKTIAHRLGISLTTVRGYVQGVLQKLGAHSKLEAVVVASRNGLLRE